MARLRELQHASPQQWMDRSRQVLPYAVSALLVVAIAWQLVQLTWLLLSGPQLPDAGPVAMAGPARAPAVDLQRIAGAHLFDAPGASAPQQSDINAPQTTMNLRLAGTIASDDPSKGYAIIGEQGGQAKFYATGATIPGNAKLHAVYADRVILDRSGQLEALLLPRQFTPTQVAAAPPPPQPNRFADNLRQIAQSNPGALTEVIRPQPVFANGTQRGFRVYPGRNRTQFAQLGLRPGDLILAINGTPLDDPNRGAEIFNTIGSSDRVTVSLERAGQTQELTLNTAQITLPSAEPSEGAAPSRPMQGMRRPSGPETQ